MRRLAIVLRPRPLVALVVAILALVVTSCALSRAVRYRGTMSCTCEGTGCQCAHCRGESNECGCRGTDAYGTHDGVGGADRDR